MMFVVVRIFIVVGEIIVFGFCGFYGVVDRGCGESLGIW